MHPNRSPQPGIALSREQRDAIHADVLNHLSGVGDVYLMIERGELADAQRLRREFEEDMRLLDDLGWAEDDTAESFELTMPRDQLARAMRRLHDRNAEALRAYTQRDTTEEDIAAREAVACSAYGMVFGRVAELTAIDDSDDPEEKTR
jgi:hypothetical protein